MSDKACPAPNKHTLTQHITRHAPYKLMCIHNCTINAAIDPSESATKEQLSVGCSNLSPRSIDE